MTSDAMPPACSGADLPSCYVCFGEGPDDLGQPLIRDCSCRGTAGFMHLTCLVEFAEHKTVQWNGEDPLDLAKAWETCTHCKQEFQGQLAIDLANKFLAFTQARYPDDNAVHLEALSSLLGVLRKASVSHSAEMKRIGHEMLSMIDQMKMNDPLLPDKIFAIEADVYNYLGVIYYVLGTVDGIGIAIAYFEKDLAICQDRGFSTVTAETCLALARNKCGSGSQSEAVEQRRLLYKQNINTFGEGSFYIINAGADLAADLEKTYQVVEATRLLKSVLATSNQVHGPSHRLTQEIEGMLKRGNRRWVKVSYYPDEANKLRALRYSEVYSKLVVQGANETFDVAVKDVRFELGTPVVCHRLKGSLGHLNDKIGELRSWDDESECFTVHFEENNLGPHSIKQDYLRIVFDLPDISEHFPRAVSKSFVHFGAEFLVMICVALILDKTFAILLVA